MISADWEVDHQIFERIPQVNKTDQAGTVRGILTVVCKDS
jgi:hypothetical protein